MKFVLFAAVAVAIFASPALSQTLPTPPPSTEIDVADTRPELPLPPPPPERRYVTPFWCAQCQQFSYYTAPASQRKTTCAHCRSVAVRTVFQKRRSTPQQTIEQWGNDGDLLNERGQRWRPARGSGFGFGGGFGSTMSGQACAGST